MKKHSAAQSEHKGRPGILGNMLLRLLIQRLFVPTLILLFLTLGVASFLWDRSLGDQQIELARVLAVSVETFLENAQNMLRSAAKVADRSREMQLSFYLKSSREGFGYFDTIYRLNRNGLVVQLEPHDPRYMGLDQTRQPFFLKAKTHQGFFISRPFNSMRTGKPTVNMTWPLKDGGMMVAELNLGTFQDAVTATRHENGKNTIIIVDQAGTFLVHPHTDLIAQQTRITNLPLLQRARSGNATMHYRFDNQWILGSSIQVKSTGWVVLVQTPLAIVYGAFIKAAVPVTIICLVLWGIVVLTFRQRFWQRVVDPLADLSQTAIAISSGDLERTANVEKDDEIGIVAKAFNSMTAQLRDVIGHLEIRVDQLTQTREELKTHQEELERLVETRTATLAERTRQLEAQALELSTAKQQAETANASKSEFLARMSHEIRTPLNAVIGLTNIVLKSKLETEQRDNLNKVQIASDNLLAVINDILDFSKVEAGQMALALAPFDLDQVLEQVTDLFSSRVAPKDLELIFAVAPNVPRLLTGDAGRLTQVLTNLIENAIKFTETGEIVVSVNRDEHAKSQRGQTRLKFQISDTGSGIDAEALPTLFEPFTQADRYLTRQHEGTGLGLAICQRLVDLMGGRIWARSTLGQGSTFSFTVEMERQSIQKTSLRPPPDLHGLKSLVVDDNTAARQVMVDLLESFTFNVSAVDSGEKAIIALEQTPIDAPYRLVLMDWKMPMMDGIETVRRIRSTERKPNETKDRKPEIPIILMVTAYGHKKLKERIDDAAADTYLFKPVKPSNLFNIIIKLISREELTEPHRIHKQPSQPTGRLAGRRILVVEDSALNRDVAVAILHGLGVTVEIADNGKAALDKITTSPASHYDAILMDIQMPIMDGYEATRHIREWGSRQSDTRLPIIALTAHALVGEKDKCLAAGMDDYIAKPIDETQLVRILFKWILHQQEETDMSERSQTEKPSESQTILDVQGALKRMGGRKAIYIRALHNFKSECTSSHETIVKDLAAGDRKTASRTAHSVKGVASTIGAVSLSQAAAELESVITSENQVFDGLLEDFRSELEQAVRTIDGMLKAQAQG